MARARTQTLVAENGKNGAAEYSAGVAPAAEHEARRVLVIRALLGAEAQTLYFAMPGSTLEGWAYLERLVEPLRKYVLDGDPPWTRKYEIQNWEGVPTPAGDCAEDALPREARNPYREQAKKNGERTHA